MKWSILTLFGTLCLVSAGFAREPIRFANNPALSPDGKILAFDYLGDIWTVPTEGGVAKALTQNPARDTQPKFSPDGSQIAFVSERDGSPQVYLMPATGGTPQQVTFNTAGYALQEWTGAGKLLVSSARDNYWRRAERFFIVDPKTRKADELLFDDYGASGTLSPDGKTLAFTREGEPWWRKGYKGSRAVQLWLYNLESKKFSPLGKPKVDARWPLWSANGKELYFVSSREGTLNLWQASVVNGVCISDRQITNSDDDSVVFPCISRDGSTIVYRQFADLYRISPAKQVPMRIEIYRDDDRPVERVDRRTLASANSVDFTSDGLEIAFIAGGDLWVMDTVLREPKRVTRSPEDDRTPVFSPDGKSIFFVSDNGGATEIWKATRSDPKKAWWLNDQFKLEKVTSDGEPKTALKFSPEGSKLAYIRGRGNLWVADADGNNPKLLIESWNPPSFDWSPDGKWVVYAVDDPDFNRDIWIKPVDGSRPPFNVSRHPFNEDDPVWSPDGKAIAFIGARERKEETDIFFVFLRTEDSEKGKRDRTMEKALEKMKKGGAAGAKRDPMPVEDAEPELAPPPRVKGAEKEEKTIAKKGPPEVIIDFDGIKDRIRRVTIENSNESGLFWSPDSKKLAFTGRVDGQAGTYSVEIPENLTPTQISTQTGTHAKWLKNGQIAWLSGGIPGSISSTASPVASTPAPATPEPKGPRRGGAGTGAGAGGSAAPASGSYRFTAYQDIDIGKRNQAAFDMCWRTMRDNWYDERLGNKNWKAIREKYLPVADTTDTETLTTVVQLMLGELNGSHLGFQTGPTPAARRANEPPSEPTATGKWRPVTAHLGVRFEDGFAGPGLKIRDVIPESPADQQKSRLHPGEIIASIDGVRVDPTMDLSTVLNGVLDRDIHLTVTSIAGKERDVTIRPISQSEARALLYPAWIRQNQKKVDDWSKGTLGYLHIEAMSMPSFFKFEEELYNAGAGKDGLIIDVRENGGGSTTDHLLTALTQPKHSITVPRGGGPGYPQDRTVYATWDKPILVLCNQNSYSNAEIFSHAIKTLRRGHLVGVTTAGGVISTGAAQIMDVGLLRLPTRGWFLIDSGEDMELRGAVPDFTVWPEPGELPKGKDTQLAKGVDVLLADVETWKKQPRPSLKKATQR